VVLNTGQVGIPPIQINPLGYAGDSQNVVPITNANRTQGAAANTWFYDNGGTAPIFAGLSSMQYVFTDNAEVEIYVGMGDRGGARTATAVAQIDAIRIG